MKVKAQIQHKDKDNQKMILQALVPFACLKDSVLFTYRTNDTVSGVIKRGKIQDEKQAQFQSSMEFYQRRVDSKRSSDIKDFIKRSILLEKDGAQLATLFPTSMILALSNDEELGNSVNIYNDSCDLELSSNVFIVDGQHRMMGMIKLYDELSRIVVKTDNDNYVLDYLQKYKFNCTILVNFDLWEQGQVFVNVNFKQKPVNKSLYYEIFGSEYRENETDWERNKIFLSHKIASLLNTHPDSPYYERVKMLGTGKGYVSQAFVVESLQRHFKKGGLWYFDPDSNVLKDTDTNYYGYELLSFFVAIKELFQEFWPKNDDVKVNIICKTTGFGAWVRLLGMMRDDDEYTLLRQLKDSAANNKVCQQYVDRVMEILSPVTEYGELLFGKNSEFLSSSGLASVSKLYKKILFYLQLAQETKEIQEPQGSQELPFSSNKICEELQEYLWTTPIEDLNPLGHHYEVENISEFKIVNFEKDSDEVFATFSVHVNIYLDNEETSVFSMQFPADATMFLNNDDSGYHLDENNIKVSVNTSKYYL